MCSEILSSCAACCMGSTDLIKRNCSRLGVASYGLLEVLPCVKEQLAAHLCFANLILLILHF